MLTGKQIMTEQTDATIGVNTRFGWGVLVFIVAVVTTATASSVTGTVKIVYIEKALDEITKQISSMPADMQSYTEGLVVDVRQDTTRDLQVVSKDMDRVDKTLTLLQGQIDNINIDLKQRLQSRWTRRDMQEWAANLSTLSNIKTPPVRTDP